MKPLKIYLVVIWSLTLFVFGCMSTRSVVKKNYNFSAIRKVAVLRFSGSGGDAVSNEFIRQFIESGISVIDKTDSFYVQDLRSLGVDAVVGGNVVEFNPASKLLVFKDKGNIMITDRAVPISGTTVLPTVNAFGLEDANVFSVSASATISAKMLDASTGEVVWSDSGTYEGLDINTAIEIVITSFKRSLKPFWRELQ